jgi:diaminopimelate epimerase
LIALLPATNDADCAMELRNADGELAEMSGNGIRCLAWVAVRAGLARGNQLVVETAAGLRTLTLTIDPTSGEMLRASVDMGPAAFSPAAVPVTSDSVDNLAIDIDGVTYEGTACSMGNPHWAILVTDPKAVAVAQIGPVLECDQRFPDRTNVEFYRVIDRSTLDMRVWERGVGETQSCGTGACAVAAVAHRAGLVDSGVQVRVLGGELSVELGSTILLGGPVVFMGDETIEL